MKKKPGLTNYIEVSPGGSACAWRLFLVLLLGTGISFLTAGCHTAAQTAGLVTAGIVTGSVSPANEIEQIYYLGIFDPEEQLPPQMYRVRVHGQSAFISGDSFASGWVPARLMDSLSGRVSIDAYGGAGPDIQEPSTNATVSLNVGRRMLLFGPEGFREAPANERLVIVMSSNPSKFFDAIDQTLGMTSTPSSSSSSNNSGTTVDLLSAYQAILNSREQLQKVELGKPSGNSDK
jgi:hypothetical protein